MDKIFVNAIGLENPDIDNAWNWIRNQIMIIENIELCHDERSSTLFLQLPYFWLQENLENIEHRIQNAGKVIISDLLNYDNNYNQTWCEILSKIKHDNIVCLTNNRLLYLDLPKHVNVIVNDFLFNRTKLYYFNQDTLTKFIRLNSKGFWLFEEGQYNLTKLNKDKEIKKIFLSLTRILQNSRRRLVEHLLHNHSNQGYIGCHALNQFLDNNYTKGYCPVPNNYYNETFVAIYCESTSVGKNIFHATEKTFEPLLKGIFILPYSNTNFVENLKQYYGFIMPDIIDYNYDSMYDEFLDVDPENKRMPAFLNSIDKLCSLRINDVVDYYSENFNIIEHNREVFLSTPYYKFVDKVWQQ